MLIAKHPAKNATNDHSLCWFPLKRKAGRCHSPHMAPGVNPAQIGATALCRRGSARPRQPNSSTRPLMVATANATSRACQDANGNGSLKGFPLIADPPTKINGMAMIRKVYQASPQRQSNICLRKCRRPESPLSRATRVNAAIAGAYTARNKRGWLPVSWPNIAPIGSAKKMYKPTIPQAKLKEISRNGVNELNGTRYASFAERVGGIFFPFGVRLLETDRNQHPFSKGFRWINPVSPARRDTVPRSCN